MTNAGKAGQAKADGERSRVSGDSAVRLRSSLFVPDLFPICSLLQRRSSAVTAGRYFGLTMTAARRQEDTAGRYFG